MSILDEVIVAYGAEQLADIEIHERPDGSAVIEEVTVRPLRVWQKGPDGSLTELFDEAADRALADFWPSYERLADEENQ
jgi:hypothetical protein